MKTRIIAAVTCSLLLAGCLSVRGTVINANAVDPGMLRHLVLFKFEEGATAEQRQSVIDAFQALPSRVEDVVSFEYGAESSGRGLNKDFTNGGLFVFRDEAALARYRDHPAHVEFVALTKGIVAELFIYDYRPAN